MSKIIIGGVNHGSIISLTNLFNYSGTNPLGGVIGLNGISIGEKVLGYNITSTPSVIKKTPLFLYND